MSCAADANEAPTLPTRAGDLLHFLCPLQCTGYYYVFEHYNQQAKEMSMIQEGPTYEATILIGSHDDAGTYRCWCRDNETPSYCHLKVEGIHQVVFNFTSNLVCLQCK